MKRRSAAILFLLAAPAAFGAEPVSCPFTAAELTAAFAVPVQEGKKGFEYGSGAAKVLSCRYETRGFSLNVKQMVMENAAGTKGWETMLAGKKESLPNDPDRALRQVDQGDNTNPNLHYVRGRVIVELRVLGVGRTSPDFEAHNRRLAALRRLP